MSEAHRRAFLWALRFVSYWLLVALVVVGYFGSMLLVDTIAIQVVGTMTQSDVLVSIGLAELPIVLTLELFVGAFLTLVVGGITLPSQMYPVWVVTVWVWLSVYGTSVIYYLVTTSVPNPLGIDNPTATGTAVASLASGLAWPIGFLIAMFVANASRLAWRLASRAGRLALEAR